MKNKEEKVRKAASHILLLTTIIISIVEFSHSRNSDKYSEYLSKFAGQNFANCSWFLKFAFRKLEDS